LYQNGLVFPKADITVRVTNEGPDTLNDALVNHHSEVLTICGTPGTTIPIQNAGLPMNGSMLVTLQGLWLGYAPWNYVSLDQSVCIAVVSPNKIYDRYPANNIACATAHIVLGITDHNALLSNITITNPFSDRRGDCCAFGFFILQHEHIDGRRRVLPASRRERCGILHAEVGIHFTIARSGIPRGSLRHPSGLAR
jgi:hypothetical protein